MDKMAFNQCTAWFSAGQAAHERGNHTQAITLYQAILQHLPSHAATHYHLGRSLAGCNRFIEAITHGQYALQHGYSSLQLRVDLAFWYNATSQYNAALDCLLPVSDALSDNAGAQAHLGHAYRRLGDIEISIGYAKRAISLAHQQWLMNWQILQQDYTQLDALHEAATWHRLLRNYRTDLGCSYLALQDGQHGWQHSESRGYPDEHYRDVLLKYPYWRGEKLEGKNLLILSEQGIGDELLFSNVFHDVIRVADQCLITCDPRLKELYQLSFNSAHIFGCRKYQAPWQDYAIDYVCLANSLLTHFRHNPEDFCAKSGWLTLKPDLVQFWKNRITTLANGRHLVGLAWRSRKQRTCLSVAPEYLSLYDLLPIIKRQDCFFINLQYDEAEEEINSFKKETGFSIYYDSELDTMNDFYQLAHIISALELCITPITSTYALSGAVGAKTWALKAPIHLYMQMGEVSSPFFPNTRFFTKPNYTDWQPAISEMEKAITKLFHH